MVGVPGRSRACNNCKKRKVACDEQRPECGLCVRSNRLCDGYGRGYVFVHNEPDSHRTIYKKPAEIVIQRSRASHEWSSYDLAVASRLPETISPGAVSQQQLLSNVVGSNDAEALWKNPLWRLWRTSFFESANSRHALYAAPLAGYLAWIGRRDHAPRLTDGSRQLYLRGLREVMHALRHADTALKDETLGACISLVLYETIECPERCARGYLAHVRGCLSLIEKRGPAAHQDGSAHRLFTTVRLLGALDALAKRRPSFLALKGWISIPWRLQPKSALDRLIDILLLGPEVLREIEDLNGTPPDQAQLVGIIKHCIRIDTKLDAFYQHLEKTFATPWYWEMPTSVLENGDTTEASQLFPTVFHFSNLESAQVMTLYWATSCLLLSGVTDLLASLGKDGLACQINQAASTAAISLFAKRHQWLDMAHNVCRSVEYCTLADHSGGGVLRLASSFDIAIAVMKGQKESEREFAWAVEKRGQISDQWLRLLRHEDD